MFIRSWSPQVIFSLYCLYSGRIYSTHLNSRILVRFISMTPEFRPILKRIVCYFKEKDFTFSNARTHWTVERMPGKSVVPAHIFVFVLRRQSGNLRIVKLAEQLPDPIDWRHEKRVRVHVQHGIDGFQDVLNT